MVKTLRESKAKLSELVDLASNGEDILITVRGKVKARLTAVAQKDQIDRGKWAQELKRMQATMSRAGRVGVRSQDILAEMREDRG